MVRKNVTRMLCMALAVLFLVSAAVIGVSADEPDRSNVTDMSIVDYIDTANTISYQEYISRNRELFDAATVRTGHEVGIAFDATQNCDYWTGGYDQFGQGKGTHVAVGSGSAWVLTDANGVSYTGQEAAKDAGFNLSAFPAIETYNGVNAVYTPSTGATSWTLDLTAQGITEPGLYSVKLVYYPVEGKAASIEREFFINHSAPFSEARSITLAKRWGSYLQSGNNIGTLTAIYTPAKKVQKNASKLAAELTKVKAEAEQAGLTCSYSADGVSLLIEQPLTMTSAINDFLDEYDLRFFENDDSRNELRPTMKQSPEWMVYALRDGGGYYANDLGFVIEPSAAGTVTITLAGVNEPVAISEIILTPYTTLNSYEQYLERLRAEGADTSEGTDKVKLEGEYASHTSTNVIYPVEDRASALTSPSDTTRTLLNTIGTEKWETAGQWAEYRFTVNDSGMYDIFARFKQSYLDGLYVSRSMQIFTDYASEEAYRAAHSGSGAGYYNGIPFEEATQLRFDYGSSWQVTNLTNSATKTKKKETKNTFEIYLEKDVVYTIRLEVTLGSMSENVRKLENILNALNTDYLDIIKLTGSSPDTYRDYSFSSLLPDTLIDMIRQSYALEELSTELKKNTASTYTGICDKLANLLDDMGHDEDSIAKNLSNFKSYVGSLGTFLTDAKTQPLQLDYLVVQGASVKAPKANSNFFVSFAHEFSGFIQSFFRDYNNMGARADVASTDSVNVWLAYGRDQAQVIRNLATNDFTANSGIAVDLKLVSGGTLLPSILANMGPDVYLGLGQADVINYAIRGALMNIEDMEGFDEVVANFNEAAMVVLRMDDADGDSHCYGLPENQQFPMMFVRIDILASLGIEIPRTWEDVYVAQSKLESNNMEIGVNTNYKIFLYQLGGELFADNGMRINLDSIVGLEAFETMCNMFTQYSFPYSYNAANRFRTGEMPIIISDYTALYNHLKVFATELDGCWSFVPLPGYEQEDGSINNCSVSSVTAAVMIKGKANVTPGRYKTDAEYREALKKNYGVAWEFTKWYTDYPCQVNYATEMVAIIGDSAKHSTANHQALREMPWTEAERTEVEKQFSNLASIPNYPGYYYIDRYTNFAFLSAYNDDADPSTELLSYINTINKEITRKREEFNLETLEIGQTLAKKRSGQANTALELLAERYGAATQGNAYNEAYRAARYGITNQRLAQVVEAAKLFAQLLDPGDGSVTAIITERLKANDVSQRTSYAQLKAQEWFVYVSKQTASSKNGGYRIDSLSEKELTYFITECLCNLAVALQTY